MHGLKKGISQQSFESSAREKDKQFSEATTMAQAR